MLEALIKQRHYDALFYDIITTKSFLLRCIKKYVEFITMLRAQSSKKHLLIAEFT